MIYLLVFVILFVLELLYFKVAGFFNIVDRPNERSSHTNVTLRGGGVIFYFAVLAYFVFSGLQYPWFFIGLTVMTIISFLDDVFSLSNRVRLLAHFSSVLLVAVQLNAFIMPWFYLVIAFVAVVGVINAYNFMDGINGITASYSLAVVAVLMLENGKLGYISQDLLLYVMIGLLIFSFFNFRMNARCFAGDVGSVAIAYILIFALASLILKTNNLIYLLLLSVYGVDTFWTIVRRVYLKENIFEAHRSHLYQYLANEAGVNKLLVSTLYAGIQFAIGLAVIYVAELDNNTQWWFTLILLTILSVIYLVLKQWIIKRYVVNIR